MSHVTSKIFLAAHRSINLNKQKERACLFTFISRKCLPTVDEHTFHVFVSKMQNEQGILSFLNWV